ncbi:hypothetical protein CEF21_19885 [Bacillus sp. FJAT-42376]|nr:hypothetical protein CEF21_19885 [Bacillus sp. FJAT-42376]
MSLLDARGLTCPLLLPEWLSSSNHDGNVKEAGTKGFGLIKKPNDYLKLWYRASESFGFIVFHAFFKTLLNLDVDFRYRYSFILGRAVSPLAALRLRGLTCPAALSSESRAFQFNQLV